MFVTHNPQEQRECHCHQGPHKDAPGSIREAEGGKQGVSYFFLLATLNSMWDLSSVARMEPTATAVGAQSLNHWTREVFIVVFSGKEWVRQGKQASLNTLSRLGTKGISSFLVPGPRWLGQRTGAPSVTAPGEKVIGVVDSGLCCFWQVYWAQAVSCL